MKSLRDILQKFLDGIALIWRKSKSRRFWNTSLKQILRLSRNQKKGANHSPALPFLRAIAAVWLAITAGLTVGSFFTFFCSLILLYLIVTKVFGIDVNIQDVVSV